MKLIWLVVIVFSVALAEKDGFGYELIMGVLENMQSNGRSLDRDLRSVSTNVNRVLDEQRSSKSAVVAKMDSLVDNERTIVTKIDRLIELTLPGEPRCPENAANGLYKLKPIHSSIPPFSVYCQNDWIEIHYRNTGKLDFNRNWTSYRDGFGDLNGEHWLGLEKMHQITRVGSFELKVVLTSFDNVEKTAKYEGFRIGSENEQYQLNLGKFVEGDAGDSLMHHNKMKFSTPDRDNDNAKNSCAVGYKSGWWFNLCHRTNLNGLYEKGKINNTMSWYDFNNTNDCLKKARMLIRRK